MGLSSRAPARPGQVRAGGPRQAHPHPGAPLSSVLGGWAFVLSFFCIANVLGGIRTCTVSPLTPPQGTGGPSSPIRLSPAQATGKYSRPHHVPPPGLTPVLPLCRQLCARPPHERWGFPQPAAWAGAPGQHRPTPPRGLGTVPRRLRGRWCCCVLWAADTDGPARGSRARGLLHSGDGAHVLRVPSQTRHRTVLHDKKKLKLNPNANHHVTHLFVAFVI